MASASKAPRLSITDRIVRTLREGEGLGIVTFVVACVAAFRANIGNRFLPGWDYHYHLMSATIAARQWRGDKFFLEAYRFMNPLDANTLYYTLLFPLQLIGGPMFAARTGITLFYFVGYPVACAIALRIVGRPIWGALLAFGVTHVWSVTYGGFMHFGFAAPWFVLSIALMERVLNKPTLRVSIACAVTCVLTFLGHAHVYGWMMGLLALATMFRIAKLLGPGILGVPRTSIADAIKLGVRALLVVLPSLILLAVWYYRTQYGELKAEGGLTSQQNTWLERYNELKSLLTFTREDKELLYLMLLPLVCATAWLLSGRLRDKPVTFEMAFLLTAGSYLVLPLAASGQTIGSRHVDMAVWLLPLVVYPAKPKELTRRALIVVALGAFAWVRASFYGEQLRALQQEFAGLVAITKECPPRGTPQPALVAYMTMGQEPKAFRSPAVHQAHETLAAACQMDTPVYDSHKYPHNVIPLRYRGPLPAPITIMVSDPRWYAKPGLWDRYEYVLVRGWTPSPAAQQEAEAVAVPIRTSAEWTLWKRR